MALDSYLMVNIRNRGYPDRDGKYNEHDLDGRKTPLAGTSDQLLRVTPDETFRVGFVC